METRQIYTRNRVLKLVFIHSFNRICHVGYICITLWCGECAFFSPLSQDLTYSLCFAPASIVFLQAFVFKNHTKHQIYTRNSKEIVLFRLDLKCWWIPERNKIWFLAKLWVIQLDLLCTEVKTLNIFIGLNDYRWYDGHTCYHYYRKS